MLRTRSKPFARNWKRPRHRYIPHCPLGSVCSWRGIRIAQPHWTTLISSFRNSKNCTGIVILKKTYALIGGPAILEGKPVMMIGHQKGRDTKENMKRNFGCPHPEGYRKAMRLMKQAEKFQLPIITFVDTQGAYPGVGAEERHVRRSDRGEHP